MIKQKQKNIKLEDKLKNEMISEIPGKEKKSKERRTDDEIREDKEKQILGIELNPLLSPIVKMPFKVWADTQNVPELDLTALETQEFTLQVSRVLEYYLPKKSPVAMMWLGFLGSLSGIMLPRMQIIAKIKKEKKKQETLRFICSVCKIELATKEILDEHIKTIHNVGT